MTLAYYQKRIISVIEHLYDHFDEEISLESLADKACVSPYHWHRLYRATTGETFRDTLKRIRLHHAAYALAYGEDRIENIANRAGYQHVASFNRAFKDQYQVPPAQYRMKGQHRTQRLTRLASNVSEANMNAYSITLSEIKEQTLIGYPHQGDYMSIGVAFDKLFAWLGSQKLLGDLKGSFGVYYNDPHSVTSDELKSLAAVVLNKPIDTQLMQEAKLEKFDLPHTEMAILEHKGPYSDLESAYEWLYQHWLPGSDREIANLPVIEEYLNDPKEVAPTELLTHIMLPLKPKTR